MCIEFADIFLGHGSKQSAREAAARSHPMSRHEQVNASVRSRGGGGGVWSQGLGSKRTLLCVHIVWGITPHIRKEFHSYLEAFRGGSRLGLGEVGLGLGFRVLGFGFRV